MAGPQGVGFCSTSSAAPAAPTKGRDIGGDPTPRRKLLVVSTVEHPEAFLRSHIAETDTVKVVVPVLRQGVLDWLANDEKAFSRAERVAARTAEELPGETDDAVAGEAEVALAVRDALATFSADEIIVVVRANEQGGPLESAATASTPQHSLEGVPVRFVVASEEFQQ